MLEKTCGFTGHRKLDWYQGALATAEILGAVMKAASEGYTRFITGLADGTDMIFADNVISVRETFGLKLELVAAISHRGRLNTKNKDFQKYLAQCDHVEVLSERYLPSVYEKRNRWIVLCEASHNTIYEKQMVMQSNRIKVAYNNLFCADDFTLP